MIEKKIRNKGLIFQNIGIFNDKLLMKFIENVHSDYFKSLGKKNIYIRKRALIVFYYNIFDIYIKLFDKVFDNEYEDKIKTLEYIYENQDYSINSLFFKFLNTNTRKKDNNYFYKIKLSRVKDEKISFSLFSEVIKNCLLKNKFVKYRRGYHCSWDTNKSYLGNLFINFSKIESYLGADSIKCNVEYAKKLINFAKNKKKSDKDIYIELRNNRNKTEKDIIYDNTSLERYSIKNRKILSESLEFCNLQKQIYQQTKISIQNFDDASKERQKLALEIYKSKKYSRKYLSEEILVSNFKSAINAKNLYISVIKDYYKFRRIFHYFDKKSDFNYYGRFFSGCLDFLEREYKALLLMNNKECKEFDIVSSVTQITALLCNIKTFGVDFYEIDELYKYGITRDDIKHGYLLLQNCSSINEILNSLASDHRWNLRELFKDKIFQSAVYKKYKFLERYHLNSRSQLAVLAHESNLLREVISVLYNNYKVSSIYNFDALYVACNDNLNIEQIVSDVFEEISIKLFNNRIYIKSK